MAVTDSPVLDGPKTYLEFAKDIGEFVEKWAGKIENASSNDPLEDQILSVTLAAYLNVISSVAMACAEIALQSKVSDFVQKYQAAQEAGADIRM